MTKLCPSLAQIEKQKHPTPKKFGTEIKIFVRIWTKTKKREKFLSEKPSPINSCYYKNKNKSEFLRTDDADKLPTFKRERERERD